METHEILIIGAGPAGMAAAAAAYDAGARDVVLLDRGEEAGGILSQCIHNGFGLTKLGKELTGPEYAAVYAEMLEKRGIEIRFGTTVTALSPDRTVTVQSRDGVFQLRAGAVILAMGCRERSRGALSIPGSRPAGIYSAGTAQKLMNCMGCRVGKRVVILGSGDIGLIMARRLSLEGAKVEAVCELLPYPGGLTRNLVQCLEDFEIPLYLRHTVTEIRGKERLEGVTVAEVDAEKHVIPGTEREIPCDTLLLSVGLIPENELTRSAGIRMDPVTNGAVVDETRQTSAEGIFACGNVLQVHDLVDYVSDEAELAGKSAAAFVKGSVKKTRTVSVTAGAGVRYVVPQRLQVPCKEVSLFLRVAKPCGRVCFTVRAGDRVLKTFRRLRAMPGEMERLTLTEDCFGGKYEDLSVSLEETE